jgi:histidinol-phosphatase (PHP family)
MRANYHTHSDFCDGKASPAEMAMAARAAGYEVLGFSGHAPFPQGMRWAVKPERLGEYAAEIRRLKAAWAPGGAVAAEHGPLEVLLGLEIDWFPPESSPADGRFAGLGLDYSIGSVHFAEVPGFEPFTVDSNSESFALSLARAGGDARALYRDYYARLAAMIEAGGFDILGHFDLVKMNNRASAYFDEADPDYLAAAFEAADCLKGKDIVVEINLGGLARGKSTEPYPSLTILRRLRELDVPITFCADAHAPSHLGSHLEDARLLAREAGYASLVCLSGGRWNEAEIAKS